MTVVDTAESYASGDAEEIVGEAITGPAVWVICGCKLSNSAHSLITGATIRFRNALSHDNLGPKRSAPHARLFDHLVGAGEQRWRNIYPQRLGRLQIDQELEFGRLVDRDVARFWPC
jgi:hypothetical protein